MRAGRRNQYVTVETPTRVADGDGGYTETWAAGSPANAWLAVEAVPAGNAERLVANVIEGRVTHICRAATQVASAFTIKTRFTLSTGAKLLVRWLGVDYERRGETVMACEEILA